MYKLSIYPHIKENTEKHFFWDFHFLIVQKSQPFMISSSAGRLPSDSVLHFVISHFISHDSTQLYVDYTYTFCISKWKALAERSLKHERRVRVIDYFLYFPVIARWLLFLLMRCSVCFCANSRIISVDKGDQHHVKITSQLLSFADSFSRNFVLKIQRLF